MFNISFTKWYYTTKSITYGHFRISELYYNWCRQKTEIKSYIHSICWKVRCAEVAINNQVNTIEMLMWKNAFSQTHTNFQPFPWFFLINFYDIVQHPCLLLEESGKLPVSLQHMHVSARRIHSSYPWTVCDFREMTWHGKHVLNTFSRDDAVSSRIVGCLKQIVIICATRWIQRCISSLGLIMLLKHHYQHTNFAAVTLVVHHLYRRKRSCRLEAVFEPCLGFCTIRPGEG